MAGQTLPAPLIRPALETGEILYVSFFLHGNSAFPKFKFFYHKSRDIRVVTEAVKNYLSAREMGRHVRVEPAFMNLTEGESDA